MRRFWKAGKITLVRMHFKNSLKLTSIMPSQKLTSGIWFSELYYDMVKQIEQRRMHLMRKYFNLWRRKVIERRDKLDEIHRSFFPVDRNLRPGVESLREHCGGEYLQTTFTLLFIYNYLKQSPPLFSKTSAQKCFASGV